jgi:glutathione S-transferase
MATLHRCLTPTNWLCPCGRTARALKRAGVEYDTVRVPYRKRDRAQVIELTGQRRVPVLVLGDQAIVDSKRIVEHLEWRETRLDERSAASRPGTPGSA